jgi:hypothetical protein
MSIIFDLEKYTQLHINKESERWFQKTFGSSKASSQKIMLEMLESNHSGWAKKFICAIGDDGSLNIINGNIELDQLYCTGSIRVYGDVKVRGDIIIGGRIGVRPRLKNRGDLYCGRDLCASSVCTYGTLFCDGNLVLSEDIHSFLDVTACGKIEAKDIYVGNMFYDQTIYSKKKPENIHRGIWKKLIQ